jgi:hypothetical protein
MRLDQTVVYRALIQTRETVNHEWVDLKAYGPYDGEAGCRDHGAGWARVEVAAGLRRRVTQRLAINALTESLHWVDVDD